MAAIVSTTLSGNAESSIKDAIESVVDAVDLCAIIDTGITDRTLDIALRAAKGKGVVAKFPWINDFAAARNFSLLTATKYGGSWAFTIDTDERMDWRGEDLRAVLASTSAAKVMVNASDGTYAKERCIRLPAQGGWYGPTHECFISDGQASFMKRARFWELPKTNVQLAHKNARDAAILERHVASNPNDPRWFFYLGDTYQHMRRFADAVAAFEACTALRGWPEEAAWACFKRAECLTQLQDFPGAYRACLEGLTAHPDIAELAWMAGWCAFQLKDYESAIGWAQRSMRMGNFCGYGNKIERIGFKFPNALYELPFDLAMHSHRARGEMREAEEAEFGMRVAKAVRCRV